MYFNATTFSLTKFIKICRLCERHLVADFNPYYFTVLIMKINSSFIYSKGFFLQLNLFQNYCTNSCIEDTANCFGYCMWPYWPTMAETCRSNLYIKMAQ